MAFKTRRQKRYELLRQGGLLPFEAKDLSRVPLKVPYIKPLLRARAKEYKKAYKENWTVRRWRQFILDKYKENNWIDSKKKPSAWAMLRDYEADYRAKFPQYKSPWEKERKDFKKFTRFFEKKMAELPPPLHISDATLQRDAAQRAEAREHFRRMEEKEQ